MCIVSVFVSYYLLVDACVIVCVWQNKHRPHSLRDLRSLEECVRFLNHWKEQVEQVCKVRTALRCTSQSQSAEFIDTAIRWMG